MQDADLQSNADAERGNLAMKPATIALHTVHDAKQIPRPQARLPNLQKDVNGLTKNFGLRATGLRVRGFKCAGIRSRCQPGLR